MNNKKQTAAEVLAISLCELFPNAECLSAHITGISFAYDFLLDHTLDQQLLLLIEEKMREVGKRNTPIEKIEMMPQNAKALFEHHHQYSLASLIEQETCSSVPLIRIGKFYDRYLPGIGENTGEMGFIHLTHFEKKMR